MKTLSTLLSSAWALMSVVPAQLAAVEFDPMDLRSASVNSNNTIIASDVAVSGNHAFVAAGTQGLKVFEIAPSGQPTQLPNGYDTAVETEEALAVAVSGDYAFLAFGSGGLHVVKINPPGSPQLWAKPAAGSGIGFGADVAVVGNHAYLATLIDGLQIIQLDLANANIDQRLTLVGSYDPPGRSALAVAVSGGNAYVAFGNPGLEVIDISIPASPQFREAVASNGPVRNVSVSGNNAYLVNNGQGLTVLDISDPTDWDLLGVSDPLAVANGVAADSGYAFVAAGTSLKVIDIRYPYVLQPMEVTSYPTVNARNVALSGSLVYVADGTAGLRVFKFSPANSQRIGGYDTDGFAVGVAVSGNHAYLAEENGDLYEYLGFLVLPGLKVIDISDPENPQLAGNLNTEDGTGVAVVGNHAYFTDEFEGTLVVDVSNKNLPQRVRQYDLESTGGFARNVAISGNHAYVCLQNQGLRVIDLTHVNEPPVIVAGSPLAWDVAIAGNFAYLAAQEAGLQVINIAAPASPAVVSTFDTDDEATGVAVSGNYAYVAGGASLQVIDISNPANPQWRGGVNIAGSWDVAVSGNHAYVTSRKGGLHVIDISSPTNPQRVGGNRHFPAYGVTVSGDKVYVAAGHRGLVVLDVFRPYQMTPLPMSIPGTFKLQVNGPRNVPVTVQRSVNLMDWENWQTVTPADGAVEVSDPITLPGRFYRAFP